MSEWASEMKEKRQPRSKWKTKEEERHTYFRRTALRSVHLVTPAAMRAVWSRRAGDAPLVSVTKSDSDTAVVQLFAILVYMNKNT